MGTAPPSLSGTLVEIVSLHRADALRTAALCLARPPLNALTQARFQFLHPDELACFSTLKFEKRQVSYLIGRYCAKQSLAALWPSLDPASFNITAGVFNQPVVRHAPAGVQVSISHAADWGAAIAFPEEHPMAVDIEEIKSDKGDVIRSQLTADENRLLASSQLPEIQALTLLWTVKEAMSKAIRCGMMTPFAVFEINTLERVGGRFVSTFANFAQYKAISFFLDAIAVSIISPKNTQLHFEMGAALDA